MKNIIFISINMNEEKKLPKIWHPQQEKILRPGVKPRRVIGTCTTRHIVHLKI